MTTIKNLADLLPLATRPARGAFRFRCSHAFHVAAFASFPLLIVVRVVSFGRDWL